MTEITMKELLEAGVHFGHQKSRWNPKMRPFIFTERAGVHIFDLEITLKKLKVALDFLEKSASEGKVVLFAGTKKQAQAIVAEEAKRSGSPFVTNRWMGGTLTNFKTLNERIGKLKELEEKQTKGEFDNLTKKERLRISEQVNHLNKVFEGVKDMAKPPEILFVLDVVKEKLAVREAKKLGVPIVAVCDTNADPEGIDYIIPANDDAVRAIQLILTQAANAILTGRGLSEKKATETQAIEENTDIPEEPKPKKRALKKKVAKKEEPNTDKGEGTDEG